MVPVRELAKLEAPPQVTWPLGESSWALPGARPSSLREDAGSSYELLVVDG
jgi:hypothetical protein